MDADGTATVDALGEALIDDLLGWTASVDVSAGMASDELRRRIDSFTSRLQDDERISLLKTAVALMPALRESPERTAQRDGVVLYETAASLYGAKLPLDESDLAELLAAARHDCGHGADTRPPFDLARAHMREHGYSPLLGDAIDVFIDNLPNTRATKVRELRRAAELLAVLSDAGDVPHASRTAWISRVRNALAELDPAERSEWQSLVLHISPSDRMRAPKNWQRRAQAFIDRLGVETVLTRLEEWWPDPTGSPRLVLDGGSAQLLKHFIWMLALLPEGRAVPLARRIADFDWPKSRRPLNVLRPTLDYLESARSPEAVEAAARLRQLVPR